MNRHNNWEQILSLANEELKPKGLSISIKKDTEGGYACDILKNGRRIQRYAENYYEEELADLVTEAWHHALSKTDNKRTRKTRKGPSAAERAELAMKALDNILARRKKERNTQTLYGDILDWTRDAFGSKDHDTAVRVLGDLAIRKGWDGCVPQDTPVEDEEGEAHAGTMLRIVVCRPDGPSLDVISVPESLAEDIGEGNGTEGFLLRLYDSCQADWWFEGPVKGIPVRVMRFTEDDDPDTFLKEHQDDPRRFL